MLAEERDKRILELKRLLLKIDAPRDFFSFLHYAYSQYKGKWFHKAIAERCQKLLRGDIRNLMVFIPPQHGKALEVHTPVLTANRGWVEHGDLKPGDMVYSPTGEPVMVEAVTCHYEWECRDVIFSHGNGIIASYNHEWGCYIPDKDHIPVYYPCIETDSIIKIKGDRSPYLQAASPLKNKKAVLPIPPYLLGLWLGDGTSSGKQVCKSASDCNFFLGLYNGRLVRRKGDVLYITFDELNVTLLKKIGVFKDKHIPRIYLSASIEQRKELLRGLMDTDGYCDKGRGNCEITQVNKRLANNIYELIAGLGYKPRFIVGDAKINGRFISKKYRIFFNPNKGDKVFSLPRKQYRIDNKTKADRSDKLKHFIKDIIPCGIKTVNCIQVQGGYYLAGYELRPTHNSLIISQAFPAWALGRNPDLKIVGASYSANLAGQFSRSIQRMIDSPEYQAIFPDTYLNGSKRHADVKGYMRNIDIFETVRHKGFYKAVGVGGSLTGTPVDIAIIDDPVKDAMEAYSPIYRERVWDWYTSVLATRLHNESRQLFIMTRWHEDDLAGRILRQEADKWTVISIPAIRESLVDGNDFDPRQVGEALWPERHSAARLIEARKRSARFFSALYQQHPTIEGGNIIKSTWFKYATAEEFNRRRRKEPIIFFIDTAFTEKTTNDPTGIIGACRIGNDLYITCAEKVNMKFPDLVRHIPEYAAANGYTRDSSIRIEPKANGISVIDQLAELTRLNVTATPSPHDSKETRLNAVSPFVECGRVCLVRGLWNDEFVEEVCGFPARPHDEYVDLLCYAIDHYHDTANALTDEEIFEIGFL